MIFTKAKQHGLLGYLLFTYSYHISFILDWVFTMVFAHICGSLFKTGFKILYHLEVVLLLLNTNIIDGDINGFIDLSNVGKVGLKCLNNISDMISPRRLSSSSLFN
eukprot:120641_1